jgi:hypothetical protein
MLTDIVSRASTASKIIVFRIHGLLRVSTNPESIRVPSPLEFVARRRRPRYGVPGPNAQSITTTCFAPMRSLRPTLRVARSFVAATHTTKSLSPVWYVYLCLLSMS